MAGSDGSLHLLSAATLGELAAAPLPGRARFAPAVVGGGSGFGGGFGPDGRGRRA